MSTRANEKCYKRLLQRIYQDNVSLKTVLEFRAKYPDTHWSKIIYSKTGESILHLAARLGDKTVVSYILEKWHPLTVDIKNNDCKTPLHEAAQFSQPEVVDLLLNYSAQVDVIKRADWTPLMLACTKNNEQSFATVSKLLNAGASCKLINKDGWTPLHLACRTGDIQIVNLLLNYDIEPINVCTNNGRTVLHIACLHGHLEIIKVLLELKVSIEVKDKCGNTPLHDAVCSGSQKLVSFLVNSGANVDVVNSAGLRCIHIAAGAGLNDMLQFLLKDLNMDPNAVTNTNVTPLHCAARNRKNEAMEILKQFGAVETVRDVHNRTADDYLKL